MALTAAQALPLISQYESSNQNVLNAQGSTASGYYQIINGTWQQFAPSQGVDLNRYPTAQSAPQSVQTQVATAIYQKQGLSPWASNTRLVSAVTAADTQPGAPGGGAGAVQQYDALGNPITTMTNSDGTPMAAPLTQQGNTVAGTIPGVLNTYSSWLWQLAQRSVLLGVGFVFIFIAVIALLWQSKTVKVGAATLGHGL